MRLHRPKAMYALVYPQSILVAPLSGSCRLRALLLLFSLRSLAGTDACICDDVPSSGLATRLQVGPRTPQRHIRQNTYPHIPHRNLTTADMASAFCASEARPDSAASPPEADFPVAGVPMNPLPTVGLAPNGPAASVKSVPRIAHRARAHATVVPGCVLPCPVPTCTRQTPTMPGVHRLVHVPASPVVSAAGAHFPPPPALAQVRRPSLQLPMPLPNGVPLRRTLGSCFDHYRILESVGSGTYANVWKVQKLHMTPRFHNNVLLTPADLMSSPKGTGLRPDLSNSLFQGNCPGSSSVDEITCSGNFAALMRGTPDKHVPSTTYLQRTSQQLLSVCGNSNGSLKITGSSASPLCQKGEHVFTRKGPVDGQIYAAKLLQLDRFSSDTLPRVLDMFSKEIVHLAACQCPGVVGLHEVVEGREGWLLVQDFIDGGTIWCEDVCRDEDEAFLHFIQLLQSVLYLQENNILHRDLKPTNILRYKQTRRVVIADFGWSERLDCCHITPMEWPGTLEINPPEIINGTGPLTDRLDNYAVGMTLLLFLSGRFVCRQKGLDAATAAPYVLRTVHELRRGPPPAVFKGSREAWTLFLGLTAPHPFRRWSLDHVLAHNWVLQKLLRLRRQAFIWHPRVLQIALGLQRAYGHPLYLGDPKKLRTSRSHGARGGCSAASAPRCSFKSVVKIVSGGNGVRGSVQWTPHKYHAAIISSVSANTHTAHNGRKLTTPSAERAASGAATIPDAQECTCGNGIYGRDAHCEHCYRVTGIISRDLLAVCTKEGGAQATHRPRILSLNYDSDNNDTLISSAATPPSPPPCTPHHALTKGLYAERGSSGSRRQSLSICSTTDSFLTNVSFQQQQQQASQQSTRSGVCPMTACCMLTLKPHVEESIAEADWRLLLPRVASKKTASSIEGATSVEGTQATIQHRFESHTNNEIAHSVNDGLHHRQSSRGVNACDRQLECMTCEMTNTLEKQSILGSVAASHVAVESGARMPCRDIFTPRPQFVLRHEEPQINSLSSVPHHRPLPWRLLLLGLAAGGEARIQGDAQDANAGSRANEHSRIPLTREASVFGRRDPHPLSRDSAYEAPETFSAKNFHMQDLSVAKYPTTSLEQRQEFAMHETGLRTSGSSWIQSSAFGKARLSKSNPHARQEGLFVHVSARNAAFQYTPMTQPEKAGLAPVHERSLEKDGVYDESSSWRAFDRWIPQLADPAAYEDVRPTEILTREHRLHREAATVHISCPAETASYMDGESVRRNVEHTLPNVAIAASEAHLKRKICSTLDCIEQNVSTASTPTWDRTTMDGQTSAVTSRYVGVESDASRCLSRKFPLERHKQHALPLSGLVSIVRKNSQQLFRPSHAALSFPLAASQRSAVRTHLAPIHRFANIPFAQRRLSGALAPTNKCDCTLLSPEILEEKLVHTGLPQNYPHPALSQCTKTCAVLATDQEGHADHVTTSLMSKRQSLPAPESEPHSPILSRAHDMQWLPSQQSPLPCPDRCNSGTVLPGNKPIREDGTAEIAPDTSLSALHVSRTPSLVHALETVGRATEEARPSCSENVSRPAVTRQAAASITCETPNLQPFCAAATLQRRAADVCTGDTQEDETKPSAPRDLVKLDAACLADVHMDQSNKEGRDPGYHQQKCCREWGVSGTQTPHQHENIDTQALPPVGRGLARLTPHLPVAQGTDNARIDAEDVPACDKPGDGTQAVRSPTKQRVQQATKNEPHVPNSGGILRQSAQLSLSELRQSGMSVSFTCSSLTQQQVEAAVPVTHYPNALKGHDDNQEETDTFLKEADEGRPASSSHHVLLQNQHDSEASRRALEQKCRANISSDLNRAEDMKKIEQPARPPGIYATYPSVQSTAVSPPPRRDCESTVSSSISTVAGYVTRLASSTSDRQQVQQSMWTGCAKLLCEKAGDAAHLLSRDDDARTCTYRKITGTLEFHDRSHSSASSLSPLASFSRESGVRQAECRGQLWSSDAPFCQLSSNAEDQKHTSSTSEKLSQRGETSRQSLDMRAVDGLGSGTVALATHRSFSERQRGAQTSRGDVCVGLTDCVSAARSLRSEDVKEPDAAPQGAEAGESRLSTGTNSYSATATEVKCLNSQHHEKGIPVDSMPGIDTGQKLHKTTENQVYSATTSTCRAFATSDAAAVCTPYSRLQRREHSSQQQYGRPFYSGRFTETGTKCRKNNLSGKGLTLSWQRAASFPASVTATRAKWVYSLVAPEDNIFRCGQKLSWHKSPPPSGVLLKRTEDNIGSPHRAASGLIASP